MIPNYFSLFPAFTLHYPLPYPRPIPPANVLYMVDPCFSLADEAQALNRAHRIGQTRKVRCVIFFVRGTVEERMLALRKQVCTLVVFSLCVSTLFIIKDGGIQERDMHRCF